MNSDPTPQDPVQPAPATARRLQVAWELLKNRLHARERRTAAKASLSDLRTNLAVLENARREVCFKLGGLEGAEFPGRSRLVEELRERRDALDSDLAATRAEIAAAEQSLSESDATLAGPDLEDAATPAILRAHQAATTAAEASLQALRERRDAIRGELDAGEPDALPELLARRDSLAAAVELGEAPAAALVALDSEVSAARQGAAERARRAEDRRSVLAGLEQRITEAERELEDLRTKGAELTAAHLARELRRAAAEYEQVAARTGAALARAAALWHILNPLAPHLPGLPQAHPRRLDGAHLPGLIGPEPILSDRDLSLAAQNLPGVIRAERERLRDGGVPV